MQGKRSSRRFRFSSVFVLTIFTMFRNHKFSPSVPTPSVVKERYLSSEIVDGVERLSLCERSVDNRLPDFDDYNLTALLNTGQPLNRVSPVLFHDKEAEAAHIIDGLVNSSATQVTESVSEKVDNLSNDN